MIYLAFYPGKRGAAALRGFGSFTRTTWKNIVPWWTPQCEKPKVGIRSFESAVLKMAE
jgi:hypothetical protein